MPKARVKYTKKGYRCLYEPGHPSAMKGKAWGGYVYEHVMIMEEELGRQLHDDEEVHHLDLNPGNNRRSNLVVTVGNASHPRVHLWILAGCPIHGENDLTGLNVGTKWKAKPKFCKCCKRTLQDKQKKFCSKPCQSKGTRVAKRPSKKDLARDMEELSWLAIGRKYGVSDNAARKWARAYELL